MHEVARRLGTGSSYFCKQSAGGVGSNEAKAEKEDSVGIYIIVLAKGTPTLTEPPLLD